MYDGIRSSRRMGSHSGFLRSAACDLSRNPRCPSGPSGSPAGNARFHRMLQSRKLPPAKGVHPFHRTSHRLKTHIAFCAGIALPNSDKRVCFENENRSENFCFPTCLIQDRLHYIIYFTQYLYLSLN